jgi:hypothetical protein
VGVKETLTKFPPPPKGSNSKRLKIKVKESGFVHNKQYLERPFLSLKWQQLKVLCSKFSKSMQRKEQKTDISFPPLYNIRSKILKFHSFKTTVCLVIKFFDEMATQVTALLINKFELLSAQKIKEA